jgi:hypothetical protein
MNSLLDSPIQGNNTVNVDARFELLMRSVADDSIARIGREVNFEGLSQRYDEVTEASESYVGFFGGTDECIELSHLEFRLALENLAYQMLRMRVYFQFATMRLLIHCVHKS